MTDARPVNRVLAATAGAVAVTGGLYLLDQLAFVPALRERSPGVWTVSGLVIFVALALAGAGLAAAFDRVGRPRGIFVLGLFLLGLSLALNLPSLPGLLAHPREVLLWAGGVGLFAYSVFAVPRAGLTRSVALTLGFLALALGWSVYSFDLAFSRHSARHLLSALFMATAFGSAVRVRRRVLRPLGWDLAGVGLALLVAGVGHLGVHLYLSSRGVLPRPHPDGIEWPRPPRPHLVLVVWDAVRRDHLSLYGYDRETTPRLEQWSKQARVFTDARTVAPWTLPSHASMFTGLYFRSHGSGWAYESKQPGVQVPLNQDFQTLAELLNQANYATGGIAANNACAGVLAGMDQGFEFFHDHDNARRLDWALFDLQSWLLESLTGFIPPRFYSPYLIPNMPAEEVTDRALAWIDSLDRDRPFFLFLNYMDAHEPTFPPEDLRYRFPGFQRDLIDKNVKNLFLDVLDQTRPLTAREREHMVSQYDAQLVRLDRETDRLRRELERRNILDHAVLVLVSDHGEFFGEHGRIWHGNHVYDELLRIPLVVRLPGAEGAGQDQRPFENRQLFHLLLEHGGVKPPPATHPGDQVAEVYPEYRVAKTGRRVNDRTRRAVVFQGFKFIESSDGHHELYDLTQDPREADNLIDSALPEAQRGRELMQAFLQTTPEAKPSTDPARSLDPEHQKKLRALGYIQ